MATKTTPRGVDLDKFCQELHLGRHDAELPRLLEAFSLRVQQVGAQARWRLTVDVGDLGPLVVDEDNMTLLEMETAERISGSTWVTLDPRRSARNSAAVVTAALMHRHDLSRAEASEAIRHLTARDLAGSFSEYLSDADPFPAADPST